MPEIPHEKVVYQCECGKKWTFTIKEAGTELTMKCACGRSIVVKNGFVYSTKRGK